MLGLTEEWRPVAGFSRYEVSSLGRVRASACEIVHQFRTPLGRHKVYLRPDESGEKAKVLLVHRLVLAAFVGPAPRGMEACHNDGNPSNNAAVNLRWDTHVNNLADRKAHGTLLLGERHHNSRFTEDDVFLMRHLRQVYRVSFSELGRAWDCSKNTVNNIVRGRSWKHVDGITHV